MTKLRKCLLSDLDRLMEIEQISFLPHEAWSKAFLKKLYQEYPEGCVVAESKNEIIGYAMGKPKNNLTGEILSLAVIPTGRKMGIGIKLYNFLIDHFREKNLKKVLLHVRISNKPAVSLYKKLDFKIIKIVKEYFQNGEDAYLMEKEI